MSVILALESSCDDTSCAVLRDGKILTNIVSGQLIHAEYGGVVPEYASRQHQKNLISTVDKSLKESSVGIKEIDAIAFTQGPGLIGSLLVTTSFAKGLALALDRPLIGVDHLHAHVMANFIDDPKPNFPFLCLLVSGGHTQVIRVADYLHSEIIGQTIDDAAGEAMDKTAKVLGLPFPGGPSIEKQAVNGNINAFHFPVPRILEDNFSFSGLKTSLLYLVRDGLNMNPDFLEKSRTDLCASFQNRVMSYLADKLTKVADRTGIREIALAGGVAANKYLRKLINDKAVEKKWNVYVPDFAYCTDNAAMIAMAGYYKYLEADFTDPEKVNYSR
jgi:N6-L-threonylcarbamoyladenine synthase